MIDRENKIKQQRDKLFIAIYHFLNSIEEVKNEKWYSTDRHEEHEYKINLLDIDKILLTLHQVGKEIEGEQI